MSNEKTRSLLMVERLASDPALKEQALSASPEEFLALCHENGLKIEADKAKTMQERLRRAFDTASGELAAAQMQGVVGGVDCEGWACSCLC